jgi:hypothetical protein
MEMNRKWAASLAAAFVVSACGGGSGPAPAPQAPQSAAAAPQPAAQPMAASGTASFAKNRASYTIARTATGYTVTDTETGSSQAVANVVSIQFADVTVNVAIPDTATTISAADLQMLTELYVAFFNRVPEADGLAFWIGQLAAGQTIDQIANSFYAAAIQFSDLTGYSATMTNEDFVRVIYKNVLGRTGDTAPPQADVDYWAGLLASGSATKGYLVRTMLTSAHSFKGKAEWGWVADLLDNKLTVASSFAITQGLNYNSAQESIIRTVAIAAAVTPTSTSAAAALIDAVVVGSGGSVAGYDEAGIPGFNAATTNVTNFVVTNRGLYLWASEFETGVDTVHKLHGNPIFNDWSSTPMSGGISGFAPSNVYSERDREVNFYWHQGGVDAMWGKYVANTGDIGFDMPDDIGISTVAAGGTSGVIAPRPWVIAQGLGNHNSDYQYVFQDDGQYTALRKTSDYFSQPAGTELVGGIAGALLLAHPTDGTLFVGAGNKLHVYSASGRQSTVELVEDGFSSITDMFWHDNTLWFAYGGTIYRRTSAGAVSAFTQLTGLAGALGFHNAGTFCINGGDILTSDGLAKRISDGAVRSWLSKGTLNATQQMQAALLEATVAGSGIFCSPNNLARAIYTPNLSEGKIRMITGLP